MKRILITAGQVYGQLDSNKIIGNRIRGVWACRFAGYLASKGHVVTLIIPDTMSHIDIGGYPRTGPEIKVLRHDGFNSYMASCQMAAASNSAAIMAAAVVNWIPAEPYPGKMPTKGFKEGDRINIPFYLAPRVINEMKAVNPNLTLIGCKMLVNATEDALIDAAYGVLLKARCNLVIANDLGLGLRRKLLVNVDRSVQEFNDDWTGFYEALEAVIDDEHYRTEFFEPLHGDAPLQADCHEARRMFNRLVEEHRHRFTPFEGDRVFGAVAVNVRNQGTLVSPREKGGMFTADDATLVSLVDRKKLRVHVPKGWSKPTLNAGLLVQFSGHAMAKAVLHFHEQVPGLPTLPYAPPGTVRDTDRDLPEYTHKGFNVEGHGCFLPIFE